MQHKKVLITNTIGLGYEGITTVIKNYVSAMDQEDLNLHFIAYSDTPQALKQYFGSYGTVHTLVGRKEQLCGYLKGLCLLLKQGFDVMHVHGNSGTMLLEVLLAKLFGVKKVIVHSHSTKTSYPLVNKILKAPMMWLADACIACSRGSGEWLYGQYPHIVLNNAIDLSEFCFRESLREKYRAEFGVKHEYLIGHIGHFTPQKNHFFLIDVFFEFHKLEPESKLLLISDGPRFEQVKQKVAELGIQDAVIFAGRRSDVAGIYSAMDLFTLPSNWEGLPLVMVEAQANGLPLLVSEVITQDAKCTDCTFYKSLSDGAESWAVQLQQIKRQYYTRKTDTHGDIAEKGFDIHLEAEKLRQIYLK